MDFINIMLPAFLECLILVGIHSYLGIHVIKRGVIFVDLALAQIAAFGSTVAFIFHLAPDSNLAFLFSFIATIIGAGIFSFLRSRKGVIPAEAGIGLTYACFAALTILLLQQAPHGGEHIQELLTGSILWVRWESILLATVIYSFVGLFHYIYREKFMLITDDPSKAVSVGMNVRLWDFLFYLSFGLVITISVRTAGVLLVFVFLIAPSIFTMMLVDSWKHRLLVGWLMGTIVTIIGLTLSYVLNLPSGPSIVICYGIILSIFAIYKVARMERSF